MIWLRYSSDLLSSIEFRCFLKGNFTSPPPLLPNAYVSKCPNLPSAVKPLSGSVLRNTCRVYQSSCFLFTVLTESHGWARQIDVFLPCPYDYAGGSIRNACGGDFGWSSAQPPRFWFTFFCETLAAWVAINTDSVCSWTCKRRNLEHTWITHYVAWTIQFKGEYFKQRRLIEWSTTPVIGVGEGLGGKQVGYVCRLLIKANEAITVKILVAGQRLHNANMYSTTHTTRGELT